MRIFGFGKKQTVKTEQVTIADLRDGDTVREGRIISQVVAILPANLDTDHVTVNLSGNRRFLAREDETVYRVLAA